MNEQLVLFENEEVKVRTDEGNVLINLVHTAKCCGLTTTGVNGNLKIRWKTKGVTEKLNKLLEGNSSYECKSEIYEILKKMDDRKYDNKNIYISINMALDISSTCRTNKGDKFYNWILSNYKNIGYKKTTVIRKEIKFLDKLEESLTPFYIEGIRQYMVKNSTDDGCYRIDYYIPQLNIAIEYDENDHIYYTYEEQEFRQNLIEKELDCKFIRVSDKFTDEYNIGSVIKQIFGL